MGVNSFTYLKKEDSRHSKYEIANDFMNCRDISWLNQVMPFIKEFSNPGDLVFEPFCGMGTTVIGAGLLGRKSIGVELDINRFKLLTSHVQGYEDQLKEIPQLICGDALKVPYPANADLIVTNYPYYNNTIGDRTGNNFYNLKDYNKYLDFIESIIIRCEKSLKPGRFMVSFCENIRDLNGNMIPQAYDILKILQKYFHLKDERIVLYEKHSYREDDYTRTNRAHEYVFICKKKDIAKNINEYTKISQKLCNEAGALLIGSFGMYVAYPEILDTIPKDCDFYIDNNIETIRKAINLLIEEGYKIYSWEDEVDASLSMDLLRDRYYIRAIKKDDDCDYIIDLSYELSGLNYSDERSLSQRKDDITLFSKESFIKLLRNTKRKESLAQAQRLEELKE